MAKFSNRNRKNARTGPLLSKRRILVFCEGKCTEPDYLRAFEKHVQASRAVVIPNHHGDPRHLVKMCKNEMDKNAREARRDPSLKYDEAWCVFDKDNHTHFSSAINEAIATDIRVAPSVPSFELWLYLHFQDPPGQCTQAEMADKLREFVEDYDKRVAFDLYSKNYGKAVARAGRMVQALDSSGKDTYGNPITYVQNLIQSILRTH